jgi:hypothetical protein
MCSPIVARPFLTERITAARSPTTIRAIRLDPSRAANFAGRGSAHYRIGDLDAAIADFSEGDQTRS